MRFVSNDLTLSREQAEGMLREHHKYIGIDIETVSLDNKLPLGVGVAVSKDTGFYFFNPHDELLGIVIEGSECVLTFNGSFDIPLLEKLGWTINSYEDCMLLAYSCGILEKSLEDLSSSVLHAPYTSVTSQWKKTDQGNIAIDHVKMGGWCLQHALNTYNLWFMLPKTILYEEIDKPFIDLIMEMEKWGLLIDQYKLTKVEQSVVNKAFPMEEELKVELGIENVASNTQIAEALRTKGIIGTRKTKGAKDSVGEESLKPLNLPITNKILKWRSLMKTLTTYVPAFRNVDSRGRLHTQFGYTNTGRLSSSKPNHQNITRDEKFSEEE
jgi:DNA polymerase I-like protein with 3'-5' exonuclease and polymerase domains